MKLGLLSDTHGHLAKTKAACERLRQEDIDFVFHGGDIGKMNVLEAMEEAFSADRIPVRVVLGNVDLGRADLLKFRGKVVEVSETATATLDDQHIGVIHGHERALLRQWTESDRFDLLITGHTHRRADRTQGKTRIINPGAVFRTSQPSAAVFDLSSSELQYLDLD